MYLSSNHIEPGANGATFPVGDKVVWGPPQGSLQDHRDPTRAPDINVVTGLICLPGRLAVLVADSGSSGEIVLPEALRARWAALERPPIGLLRGTVVAIGPPKGRGPMPQVGDSVWVMPKPGLIVYSGDVDLPMLGKQVPPGHTLRIYGAGDPWDEAVLGLAA